MSRGGYKGPQLPRSLLDRVETGNIDPRFKQSGGRKAHRKAERLQKKASRGQSSRQHASSTRDGPETDNAVSRSAGKDREVRKDAKPLKSILKTKPLPPTHSEASDDEDGSVEHVAPVLSRAVKTRLAEDDDEIAALEKKLGIKGKKSSKALEEDGLDWLAGGSDSEHGTDGLKRKRPEDSKWLQDKRRKATGSSKAVSSATSSREYVDDDDDNLANPFSDDEINSDDDNIGNPFSDDEIGSDDLDASDSEASLHPPVARPKKPRENPYVAPPTKDAPPATKYVPPSLRSPASSDEESLRQLRRQIQGQLNRLSDSNMLSILQAVEDLYTRNARQYVTSTLVDLLVSLVADTAVLNDTFLILHAGFAEAVYKTIGTDFGAQLLEKIVENIDHFHGRSNTSGKQTLNLLAFTSNLYNFKLIGTTILFDYIRILLSTLSESNTELLLRIIRTSGQQLRQDDPSALKDIVLLLQRSTAEIGEAQLSVRTKFMIETIHDLKNNRMKTGAAGSALVAEHTARMKKALSSLTTAHTLRQTEPLRISLADIRDSEKKGKWWLVGASFHDPSKLASTSTTSTTKQLPVNDPDAIYDSETPGSVNLHRLARQSGMNTSVRKAIFIAILSSIDYLEAHMKIVKLNLKRKQMLEFPRVLVHCVELEQAYNPYYALVARKFSREKGVEKAFGYQLWGCLDKVGGGEEVEGDEARVSVKWIISMGKFFAALIANGSLGIKALRKLDPDYAHWSQDTRMFVEILFTTLFLQLRKGAKKDEGEYEKAVREAFASMAGGPVVVDAVRFALDNMVMTAELAPKKRETRTVESGCRFALEELEKVAMGAAGDDDSDGGSESA